MTQVSWVRQLVLAMTLFALGSVAYWLEYQHKPSRESAQEQDKKVFKISSSPIKSITLNTASQVVELSCLDISSGLCKSGDNSKWEVNRPSKLKADDSNANSLLTALNNLFATEVIDLQQETSEKRASLLKEYGLDPASRNSANARKVAVQTTGDHQTSGDLWIAYLGLNHPISDGIFAVLEKVPAGQQAQGKVDDSRVLLIPSYFKTNFEHDLTHWRNKKLLTVASHEVESFTLESKKAGQIRAVKKDGQWTLENKGQSIPGDIENIDSLLAGTAFLSAKSFAAESKADVSGTAALKGLQPLFTLTLQKEKGSEKEAPAPITLKLYGKTEGPASGKAKGASFASEKILATVSNLDPVFELDSTAKTRLDKTLSDLRLMKLITSMERFSAKKLTIGGKTFGKDPLTLVNSDGKWIQEKNKAEVNAERVQSLLEKLSGNRIKEVIASTSAQGSEKDGVEITLGDDKNPAKRHLVFWKEGERLFARDLLLASKGQGSEVFVVDTSVKDSLPWSADYFNKTEAKPH
jgi:hypothetical protein